METPSVAPISRVKMYCGADKLNTGPNDPLVAACNIHDTDYVMSNTSDIQTRKQADLRFWSNMMTIIRVSGKWWLYPQAVVYYGIVRVAGPLFWGPKSIL